MIWGEPSNTGSAAWNSAPSDGASDTEYSRDGYGQPVNMAPRIANGIVFAVFFGFAVTACINVFVTGGGAVDFLLSIGYAGGLLALQLGVTSVPQRSARPRVAKLVLLAQACLVYLPMIHLDEAWVGLPGFLAGSALLVLTCPFAIPSFVLVVASMGWIAAVLQDRAIIVVYTVVATTITGLVVYGLTRLAQLVSELHAARRELARLAVADERLRFARDIHDLLGFGLSAIVLKTELAGKLVNAAPSRAQEELLNIREISRQAIADARAVASGQGTLSLDEAIESARSTLSAANVEFDVDRDHEGLSGVTDTVLATVLREGVTNLLRHSKAESCHVTLFGTSNEVRIDVVNDGAEQDTADDDGADDAGNGIQNLRHRVSMLGGEVAAGRESGDTYRLWAKVPLRVSGS